MILTAQDLEWRRRDWETLTRNELYDILQLRSNVFVLEQQDPYGDVDGWDNRAIHFMGYKDQQLIAYARLFLPGVKRTEAVRGRICIVKEQRNNGIGTALIKIILKYLLEVAPDADLYSYSQTYWIRRLLTMGAMPVSSPMTKSRIEHVELIIKNDKIREMVND